MKKRILQILAVLAASFAVAAVASYFCLQPAPLPVQDLRALKNQYDVRILRDTWGVPHIFGKTDADAAFGLAYAHAEDDFETIQGALLAARGQLAAVYGKDAAPNDYLVQLLRLPDLLDEKYESDLDAKTRALCEGYANGLNYFAALHPDRALPYLYPVRGKDLIAGFLHKLPLFFGLDRTIRRLYAKKRMRQVSKRNEGTTDEATAADALPFGSNTFAVAPGRSADGATRLAVNSHQPWKGPVAWYEAHLKSEEGLDVVGGTFPGAPVILHGHNRHLGWAHTVNKPDLIDVYVLETNPENPNQYRFDGEWKTLEVSEAAIRVKLFGPYYWTVKREVLWSVYGPVIRQPHGTYAIRIAGYGRIGQVEQWYRMNRARTFNEWLDAMKMMMLPMFNVGYADEKGNIYYLYNGLLPQRAPEYDWSQYLPGNTSATLWKDYLPFEKLPQVKNPPAGFVQNCNSTPFRTTTGAGNPSPEAYSPTLGIETRMTNRSLRALELFGADSSITAEEFYAYKYDLAYSPKSVMARLVRRVRQAASDPDSLLQAAIRHLHGWDLRTNRQNKRAALAILAFRRYLGKNPDSLSPGDLRAALGKAARRLQEKFGRLDVEWDRVNRLIRGRVNLGLDGGPDILRAVYGAPLPEKSGQLQGVAGDCYVLLVEWDRNGRVHSQSIHQFGTATLDSASVHFADQARLFARMQMKPVWLDEDSIRAHLEREYRPGEEMSR